MLQTERACHGHPSNADRSPAAQRGALLQAVQICWVPELFHRRSIHFLRINKLALAIHTGDRYVEETQSNMLCAGHFLRLAGCDKLFKYQLACHFYKTLYSEVRFD